MAEATKIQWTDHTFNPWRGCTKVHAGCTHCYAERDSKRNPAILGVWGDMGTRVVAAEATWREPLKWNKAAEAAGERRRVFCASLADVFEDWKGPVSNSDGNVLFKGNVLSRPWRDEGNPETEQLLTLSDVRARLFALIDATPWLDWQLLTKRPENVRRMWPHLLRCHECRSGNVYARRIDGVYDTKCPDCGAVDSHDYRPNVWIGTSISDQETADKYVPELLELRDLTPVLFLSIEPLLGPVRLCDLHRAHEDGAGYDWISHAGIDWVIVGGESGPKARVCRPEWVRSTVEQCRSASVPVFVKQMGGNVITRNDQIEDVFNNGSSGWPDPEVEHDIHGFREEFQGADCRIRLRDPKGGDPAEWPEDLRVREFPQVGKAVA